MKTKLSLFILLAIGLNLSAQSSGNLYGIVRQNFSHMVTDPIDSSISYEQFDSTLIGLGYTNPSSGYVDNRGSFKYNDAVNLTGAALNPYENTYVFIGYRNINTFNLSTGEMINSVPLSNPIADSYFDNFRFNNSDSSMYGLARRNTFDSITGENHGELYLARANSNTGIITQISPASIGEGYALAGSAIDPYQMVYYFSTGSQLIGLDLYSGNVFSNVSIVVDTNSHFSNFTYSCADTALYGLVTQLFYSYYPDTLFPSHAVEVLDSSTVKLGRIDAATGVVSIISPLTLNVGGYTLNGGAAVDPNTMTYYYSTGRNMIGVSMITGLVSSNVPYSFADGDFFDLMRNFENCYTATALRKNPSLGLGTAEKETEIAAYPNPAQESLTVRSATPWKQLSISSLDGKELYKNEESTKQVQIDLSAFAPGIYLLRVNSQGNQLSTQKIIISK